MEQPNKALEYLKQAQAIFIEIGDRLGEANTRNDIEEISDNLK